MRKEIASIILLFACLILKSQYSYNILLQGPTDKKAVFVYHDNLNDEQIVITIVECFSSDTNCIAECSIYSIKQFGDTIRWPFVDRRNDTLFSINNLFRENDGNYFMTGIGWTLDSIGRPRDAFDYNTKWNSNHEIVWENIHQRPAQFDGYSKSHNFKILKLRNGDYLVGKSIKSGSPMFPTYYFTELNSSTGAVVKEKVSIRGGYNYLQSLTYSIDSSTILLHSGRAWMNECNRNETGVFILDTTTYDTISGFCYNRDDDDPEKHWCVTMPYNAKVRRDGKLIVSGRGDCSNLVEGTQEDYLFIYEYDTGFNLTNKAFLTHPDTLYDAGWYESMEINEFNEICLAGNHDRHVGPYSSYYSQIYLAKVDQNLNLISERYLGGDAEYVVYSMAATSDGGIVVSGSRYDYLENDFEHDAFVIKTDGGLWVGQNENSSIPIHSAMVYPNPGSSKINIRTTEYPSVFELYDAHGNLQLSIQIKQHITCLQSNSLISGFYTWTLRRNGRIIDNGKWIKL